MTLVFDWGKDLVLGGMGPFKNRGHLGSRYLYVCVYHFVRAFVWIVSGIVPTIL